LDTGDQIKFLSDKSGLSRTQLLAEVFDAIFNVACTFSALNFNYDFCITESKVTITCEGKNNLTSGSITVNESVTDKEVDKMIAKRLKKVKS